MKGTSSQSESLLIVEDDEGLRRQYRWVFPELKLSLAGSRSEAIAIIRSAGNLGRDRRPGAAAFSR